MFKIGKKYKIQDMHETYYTATIIEETPNLIIFTDLHGIEQSLSKLDIKRWKEVTNP